jgi:urea carboxylase
VTLSDTPLAVLSGRPGEAALEVLDGGALTTVQDVPGRLGYWPVGVPPSGPMDDLSHRIVNRVVGNAPGAATLEVTGRGPTLRVDAPAMLALGGAPMTFTVDGVAVPQWAPIAVGAGSTVTVGECTGAGLRAYLAVRGGIDVTPYLGSRSTFTLGGFGGHEGRALVAGDVLPIAPSEPDASAPLALAPGYAPALTHDWQIGVLVGPHAAPEFLTVDGLAELFRTTYVVHFNSARTGVRLVGPAPVEHPRHRLRDRRGRPDRRHARDPRARRPEPRGVRVPRGGGRGRALEARAARTR